MSNPNRITPPLDYYIHIGLAILGSLILLAIPNQFIAVLQSAQALLAGKPFTPPAIGNSITSGDPTPSTESISPALTFNVQFQEVSQENQTAVNLALQFWQSKIKTTKSIQILVDEKPADAQAIAAAKATKGKGIDVTVGTIHITPDVIKNYQLKDKVSILIHEIAHILGMNVECGMTGTGSIEAEGESIPLGTPGHFASGVPDLLVPFYNGATQSVDKTLKVLKKCGWDTVEDGSVNIQIPSTSVSLNPISPGCSCETCLPSSKPGFCLSASFPS